GITNPPMVVTAAFLVGRRQPKRERRLAFWRRTYPGLLGFVEYLARRRRLRGSPLVAVVHPWESGWDNSPRWDHLRAARLRPRSRSGTGTRTWVCTWTGTARRAGASPGRPRPAWPRWPAA